MTAKQFKRAVESLPPHETQIRKLAQDAHAYMQCALIANNATSVGYYEKQADEALYKLDLLLVKGHL